jgi:hypothetical protein
MNESLADAVLEIPVSELQHFFNDLISTFNSLNDLLREDAILRGKELAELNTRANQAVKAALSPIEMLLVLNAYIKQQIGHIGRALQARPPTSPTDQGVIRQAITKIQLRAQAIVDHVRVLAEDKKEISFNSGQARQFLAGREGKLPSRRDAIRALRRAEKLYPVLVCDHTPGDGRQTMRLTARAEDMKDPGFMEKSPHCANRQRSRMEEIRMIFFKEGMF